MAVVQVIKRKVRKLLEFHELNKYVECHTGCDIIDVCNEKVGTIGKRNCNSGPSVSLPAATCHKEILVHYKGRTYYLTQGFKLMLC